MRIAPAGDTALLVELGDDVTAAQLHAAATRVCELARVTRCTPGHSSLYVVFDGAPDRNAVREAIDKPGNGQRATGNEHRVTVSFADEDLNEFLAHTNQTLDTFLARIPSVTLQARYLGFRAGFAYLDGWPEEWAMPRRPTSRPVRAGSFAIAGSVAGFYPLDSPGGWNLLGHTNVLPDIEPGDLITIAPTLDALEFAASKQAPGRNPLSSIVAPGEAFDDILDALVRRAVTNAVVYECAMAWPRLRFDHERVIATCGPDAKVHLQRARELAPARIEGGLRGYVAIGDDEGVVSSIERDDRFTIRAIAGPHDVGLGDIECEVTPKLDRVGIRLRPLRRIDVAIPGDLRSIGMQCGTVQLHPDGSLVAMGPDHPVTGGYLQPMTVLTGERWKLAQLAPGERVFFKNYPGAFEALKRVARR